MHILTQTITSYVTDEDFEKLAKEAENFALFLKGQIKDYKPWDKESKNIYKDVTEVRSWTKL